MPPAQPNPNDPTVIALSKSIAQHESGMNPNAVGDAGTSHGIAQWQGGTWKAEAKDVLGDENAPMSLQNQKAVLQTTIAEWKAQGLNPPQIAAKWNSGSPDNWESKIGTTTINGKQIHYDVPKYVKSVTDLYQQYKGQGQDQTQSETQTSTGGLPEAPTTPSPLLSAKDDLSADSSAPQTPETLSGQISGRLGDAGNALSSAAQGKINPLSGILQAGGAAGGLVGDVTNDALKLIPGVSQGEQALGQGVSALANTGVGKSVIGAGESFAQKHPELAADLGAVGNIASAIPAVKGLGLLKDAVGGALTGAGKDALIEAISPEIKAGTKAGAVDVAENGTVKSGLLGKVTRTPDPQMLQAAPIVKEIAPNFMKLGTYGEKVQAVQNGIGKLANELKTNLSSSEVQPLLTPEDIQTLQKGIDTQISQNPLLVGDAGKQAQQIFDQFKRFLPQQGDVTMSDVLDARKKLDSWISNIKGGNVFDPKTDNAISVGLRAVRQGANDLLENKVPEGNVKSLLKKQSLLYKVVDNLAPKASKEVGSTKLTRLAGRHPGLVKAGKYAGGALLGGLGLGEAQNILSKTTGQ